MKISRFTWYILVLVGSVVIFFLPLRGWTRFILKPLFLLAFLLFVQFSFRTDDFFQSLNYCSCNEDWRSEYRALKIDKSDRILCVTGSGDRPLNLLVENPGEIISIDMNITQNMLLSLKIEAIRFLSHEEFVKLMGFKACSYKDRKGIWGKLVKDILSARYRSNKEEERMKELVRFWDKNRYFKKKIMKGILYQGRWENYFYLVSIVVGILVPDLKYKLFEFDDLEEQKRFVKEKLENNIWVKMVFGLLCSSFISKLIFKDPGFYKHTSKRMTLGHYIYDKIINFLNIKLGRESFMLSLCFRGRLSNYDIPPYLDEAYYDVIKGRLDRILVVNANLLEFLEDKRNTGKIDKFSLSDVPSFLDNQGFNRLLEGCCKASNNTGRSRVNVRFFYSDQEVSKKVQDMIERDEELENSLALEDTSIGYRFLVGIVNER